MIDKNIDTIIFDFGGVLINIDYSRTIKAFKELGMDNFDELYSQAVQAKLFNNLETGTITKREFVDGILSYLPNGTSHEAVIKAWNAMILDVPQESLSILLSLKEDYQLFLLSNTNAIHVPYALDAWRKITPIKFEDCFKSVYYSYEIGMRKPDIEIFKFVCDQENLDPMKTLFIDDSIQHIEGAKQCGIQTIHLTNDQSLTSLFS